MQNKRRCWNSVLTGIIGGRWNLQRSCTKDMDYLPWWHIITVHFTKQNIRWTFVKFTSDLDSYKIVVAPLVS